MRKARANYFHSAVESTSTAHKKEKVCLILTLFPENSWNSVMKCGLYNGYIVLSIIIEQTSFVVVFNKTKKSKSLRESNNSFGLSSLYFN